MVKRERLEVIHDILMIIKDNTRPIKKTPLLRKSNLSSTRFSEYFEQLMNDHFIESIEIKHENFIQLSEKGNKYLEKYRGILNFIDEFGL
jgi:predicted transcriptional regulator